MQWSAILVPPITGVVQGNFHSTGGAAGLINQDFLVSGSLTQAVNTGASTAVVSGILNFSNSDYPCFSSATDTASVYGQISGNSVTLQMVGADESILGQIGEPPGANGVTGISPVTFDPVNGAYILHGVGPTYLVATNDCPGNLASTSTAGDYGDMCMSVGSPSGANTACQQPVSLTPAPLALVYPPPIGDQTSTGTITLANTSGGALSGLTLTFANDPSSATNFTEIDACGPEGLPSQGEPFSLGSGGSCVITVTFNPPCGNQCESPLNATLTVTSPVSADNDKVFTVPITGTVTSGDAVSTRTIGHSVPTAPNSSHRTQDVERHADIY
jgi:hypothetical protein